MPGYHLQFGRSFMLALATCGMAIATDGAQAQDRPFTVAPVANFTSPWAMAIVPGTTFEAATTALVTEKSGKLWLVTLDNGSRRRVTGVPSVHVAGQGGLGDVAVHPQFSFNRRVYLSYVEAGSGGTSGAVLGYGLLDRNKGSARLTNFRVIWRQTPKVTGDNHFSHRIAFASDGTIFLSSGDRFKFEPAQDLGSDLGKMIHLTDDGDPVPGGPFASSGGRADTYWTMGHRNMLGLAFAPDGRLWSTEMGPMGGDELNLILRGRNYGWPLASYGSHYTGEPIPDDHAGQGFEEPKLWWNPVIAPAGLIIYSGDLFPQWKGDALMAALRGRALVRADIEGDSATKAEEWDMGQRIREVEQGPLGEVYLLEDDGRLLRLEPVAD